MKPMLMSKHGLVGLALLVVTSGGLAGCGETEAPVFPDYSRDVAPLLHARCVRCHGAGGTLNGDPGISHAKGTVGAAFMNGAPSQGYFDCAEDRGDCATPTAASPACKRGFRFYAPPKNMPDMLNSFLRQMPPAPAPPLTDREWAILTRWLTNPSPANVPCM